MNTARPLVRARDRCLHCGQPLAPGALYCVRCGNGLDLAPNEEAGHAAYLLDVVDGWVRTGQIDPSQADRLVAPFRSLLGEPSQPAATVPIAPIAPPASVQPPVAAPAIASSPAPTLPPVSDDQVSLPIGLQKPVEPPLATPPVVMAPVPTPPIAPVVRPPAAPAAKASFGFVWANVALYLGAFFVLIASLVFLLVVGGLARTILTGILATVFLGSGLILRFVPQVRSAGTIFTAVGALIVPLIFAALINHLSGGGPLSSEQIWLAASVACAALYTVFAFARLGSFYAILSLIAFGSGWWSIFVLAGWHDGWGAAWFSLLALLQTVTHLAGRRLLRRAFGWWMLISAVSWSGISALLLIYAVTTRDPARACWALVALSVTFILIGWRLRDPISPFFSGVSLILLVAAVNWWLEDPAWVGVLSEIVLGALFLAFWRWRKSIAGGEILAIALLMLLVLPFVPVFQDVAWAGLAAGLSATFLLIIAAWLVRSPILAVLPSLTILAAWWYGIELIGRREGGVEQLGLAYLPVTGLIALIALLLPRRLAGWRWTLGGIVLSYATVIAMLNAGGRQPSVIAFSTFALLGLLFLGRWRQPWLLPLLGLIFAGLVGGIMRLVDAPPEIGAFAIMVLGLPLTALGWVLIDQARRWSLATRLTAMELTGLGFLIGFAVLQRATVRNYDLVGHLVGVILIAAAGQLALEALRKPLLWYPASALAIAVVLWEIDVFGIDQPQAFAVPLGLYLLGVAAVGQRDKALGTAARPLSGLAWISAALVFGLTTFGQTFGNPGWPYQVALLVEGIALFLLGLLVRRRSLLAASVALLVLAGVRLMFERPEFIPYILFFAGFLLLAAGVLALLWVAFRLRPAPSVVAPEGPSTPAPTDFGIEPVERSSIEPQADPVDIPKS